MRKEKIPAVSIRQLRSDEAIPYDLLLLADPSRELIDQYLPASEIYIALLGKKTIGTYVLYPINSEVVEIKNISVDEEYQQKGIGTLMLKDAAEKAKKKSYKTMIIGTGNTSFGPLYLYQKEGFEITGIKKDFFVNNYYEPLYENGIQVRHMLMLTKQI